MNCVQEQLIIVQLHLLSVTRIQKKTTARHRIVWKNQLRF